MRGKLSGRTSQSEGPSRNYRGRCFSLFGTKLDHWFNNKSRISIVLSTLQSPRSAFRRVSVCLLCFVGPFALLPGFYQNNSRYLTYSRIPRLESATFSLPEIWSQAGKLNRISLS